MSVKTKIVATIGPATLDFAVFQELVYAGIDYIRINTSYGNTDQYDTILSNLKKAKKEKNIKVMFDLKNEKYFDYVKQNDVSDIAVSFVEGESLIEQYRRDFPKHFLIAKIESKKGVEHFDEILRASDGIMVARGDLGKAISLEKIPPLQKDFTRKTIAQEKFLVTATEMLLSMTYNPKPTRAEVSDVANAVFDESSAVMLSEETAIGKYPAQTVKMMRKIIVEAEKWKYTRKI